MVDILLGSRDALEFWQGLFGIWWGIVMVYSKPYLAYNVYKPLLDVAPAEVWGGIILLSSLVVIVGLFITDVLHVNGGAICARKWGMTVHSFVLMMVFVAFWQGHGFLGSTAVPAYGVLSGSSIAITARLWICHRLKVGC
jgi:hypothetical protein